MAEAGGELEAQATGTGTRDRASRDAMVKRVLARDGVRISLNVADFLLEQIENGHGGDGVDVASLESELLVAIDNGTLETTSPNLSMLSELARDSLDEFADSDELDGGFKRLADALEEFIGNVDATPAFSAVESHALVLTRDAVEHLLSDIDTQLGDGQASARQPELAERLRLRKSVLEGIGERPVLAVPKDAALDVAEQAMHVSDRIMDGQPGLSDELRNFALAAHWHFRQAIGRAQGD